MAQGILSCSRQQKDRTVRKKCNVHEIIDRQPGVELDEEEKRRRSTDCKTFQIKQGNRPKPKGFGNGKQS